MADYSTVTEIPGIKASREQIARLFHRYHFALPYCKYKDVLEVACGAGQGLGYLAKTANKVVGIDIEEKNLSYARETYKDRKNIELHIMDAHKLLFNDKSFDVILIYEAIYYLQRPEVFLNACTRLLRKNGVLLICSVNREWSDFNPSPYSTKYFSARELSELLNTKFAAVQVFGAFSDEPDSLKDKGVSAVKRAAVALHIVPRTMKGKEALKRIFFGKLVPLPAEVIEGMTDYDPPAPVPLDVPDIKDKVIYAVARLV